MSQEVRVLVVRSELNECSCYVSLLQDLGFKYIVEATTVEDAFQHIRKETFHFILVESELDYMDGVDFIRRYRTLDDSAVIFFLCDEWDKSRAYDALRVGANRWFVKPVAVGIIEEGVDDFFFGET